MTYLFSSYFIFIWQRGFSHLADNCVQQTFMTETIISAYLYFFFFCLSEKFLLV